MPEPELNLRLCPFGQATDCNVCLPVIVHIPNLGFMVLASCHQMMVCSKFFFGKFKLPADIKRSSEAPADSTLAQVAATSQTKVKIECLANKSKLWFNETGEYGSDLPYTCINLQGKLSLLHEINQVAWT